MGAAKRRSEELTIRVNAFLNKLSDRDTLPVAASELEAIARGLPSEGFAPFLKCISSTDSSEKSPVRRYSVRLLAVMSAAHGDALSPHLSRMISAVLRRVRDPDSAVRSACVEAIKSIAAHVNSQPFAAILTPLVQTLIQEQDSNAQLGTALCLSAAVEASPEPDTAELSKILPKLLKLSRQDSFKAKPALISFITTAVNAGATISTRKPSNEIVSTAIEFLSSEDWAARKAAAELLQGIATVDKNSTPEIQTACVAALQTRRFDRVKLVRETMNRALEIWKDVDTDESPPEVRITSSPPSSCSSSISSSQKSSITEENHQDLEEFSLIRKQLLKIENQQSDLLQLLQRFMGSSQKGMNSLEKRVDGLEKVLDEMSS
ncbi:hypothetical protein M569_11576, partial [Genlisea aurea]